MRAAARRKSRGREPIAGERTRLHGGDTTRVHALEACKSTHTRAHARIKCIKKTKSPNTFPSHADFEAFFEAAVLALITVVLVDRTIPVGAACVREVPPYAPLEEALAPLASELAVVFAAGFVPADHALDVLRLLLGLLRRLVRRRGLRVVRGSLDRSLRGRGGHLRGCQIQLARLRGGKR